jgi:branched-chain amino acid transport system permease protein
MSSELEEQASASNASTPFAPPPVVARKGLNPGMLVAWVVVLAVLCFVPFQFQAFRVEQFCSWMALAIAACGLNLLTGYNGQISVGHGALYGVGAYTTGILITRLDIPLLSATVASAVVCFVVGVVVGLPALRIKGLYLALVTLAVATLFPLMVEQFSSLTGGSGGMQITSPQEYRGEIRERPIRFESPFGGLENDQWKYFIFLGITILCFVLSRNLIKSRVGRSLVAVRDNEIAAEVSGVPVARVKILTFGVSAALAGVGGSLFALDQAQIYPSSFTIAVSIYFLVAVVVGGAASIVGPAIGAVFYGFFSDVVVQELPDRVQPARAVILGVLLIILMLVAPGGVVGIYRTVQAKRLARKARRAAAPAAVATSDLDPADGP